MPRQIVHLVATRVSRTRRVTPKRLNKLYGASYGDLRWYLVAKYGLYPADATSILFDVFRYIEAEVMRGEGQFTVPRFGRFERRNIHSVAGVTPVLRFTSKDVKAGRHLRDFEDEEWVEDE